MTIRCRYKNKKRKLAKNYVLRGKNPRLNRDSIIIFDGQFIGDVEIIVEAIIVLIYYPKSAIGGGDFQRVYQVPLGTAKIIGFPVEDDAVGHEIDVIVTAANALVTRLQQMLMLVDHAHPKIAVNCDDKLG